VLQERLKMKEYLRDARELKKLQQDISQTGMAQRKTSTSTKTPSAPAENEQLKCILLSLAWFVNGLLLSSLVVALYLLLAV
jgi:hypothetical protein